MAGRDRIREFDRRTFSPFGAWLATFAGAAGVLRCSPSSDVPAAAGGLFTPAAGGRPSAGSGGEANVGTGGTPLPQGSGGGDPFGSGFMTAAPPPQSCATAAYQSQLLPSNLLFIVDRSGSMNCNLPPTTDSASCEQNPVAADATQPTKWSTIVGSMSTALDGLAQVPLTSVGLTFFSNDDICGVQSEPNVPLLPLGQSQVDTLKAAFGNVTPRGGTPIVGSVILGYKHLHQEALAPGNRFVVLVTDGADSCFDTYAKQGVTGDVLARLLNTEIPKAISVNIRTFVIGAPGSEAARGLLSKIAFLGGTARDPGCDHQSDDPAVGSACHFDMTTTQDFAKDLSAALQSITGSARTCDFDVPSSTGDGGTVDPTKVNVDYYQGGNQTDSAAHIELARDDTQPCDAGADGWQYIDGNVRIRVCGPVCDRIRADGNAEVVVSLGCEQRVVAPH